LTQPKKIQLNYFPKNIQENILKLNRHAFRFDMRITLAINIEWRRARNILALGGANQTNMTKYNSSSLFLASIRNPVPK